MGKVSSSKFYVKSFKFIMFHRNSGTFQIRGYNWCKNKKEKIKETDYNSMPTAVTICMPTA
jgi:hypothetical protein